MSKAKHYLFDVSGGSVVVIHIGCPWRTVTRSKDRAIRAAVDHECEAHPGEEFARNVAYVTRSRAKTRGTIRNL